MREISDAILKSAINGNLSAMEDIYRNYSGFIFRTALRITSSEVDAEDVTQEVFIRVFKNLNNFKFNSAFSTYLYRITINIAINYTRNLNSKKSSNPGFAYHEPIDNENVAEQLEKKELTEQFFKTLNLLGEEMRECFYLKEVEGMKYEEIASLLNENINTVKTRVRRAWERLINEFKGLKNELHGG